MEFEAQLDSGAQTMLIRLCYMYLLIFFYCIEASVHSGKMAVNISRFTSFQINQPSRKEKASFLRVAAKFQYGISVSNHCCQGEWINWWAGPGSRLILPFPPNWGMRSVHSNCVKWQGEVVLQRQTQYCTFTRKRARLNWLAVRVPVL